MIEPKPATGGTTGQRRFGGTVAQIRSALKFYRVLAYTTGTMLLLLCAEMIARYGFGKFLYAGGTEGLGRATTATVVHCTMGVIISDFFLTKLMLMIFW